MPLKLKKQYDIESYIIGKEQLALEIKQYGMAWYRGSGG
ncbi:hypothetical protein HDC33_001483 [Sporosarcina sp. JAI121]|nr:hypothetical protein [Sporosarcina sp. JAI121]